MNMAYKDFDRYLRDYPNKEGFFGDFGGQFIPDELIPAFKERIQTIRLGGNRE